MSLFATTHPEYARIEAQIRRARAERALIVGEAIGTGLIAIARFFERIAHGWRSHPQGKAA